jgi:hypothetical protein
MQITQATVLAYEQDLANESDEKKSSLKTYTAINA